MTNQVYWLIEAPGPQYLRTRHIGCHPDFSWSDDANEAIKFVSYEQADGVMMAVRALEPSLFGFERALRDAKAIEHAWINTDPLKGA